MSTFAHMAEVQDVIDREALEGFATYFERTRELTAEKYKDIKKVRGEITALLHDFREIEGIIGEERASKLVPNLLERARAEAEGRAES